MANKVFGGSRSQALAFLTRNPGLVPSLHVTFLDEVKGRGSAWVPDRPPLVAVTGVGGVGAAPSALSAGSPQWQALCGDEALAEVPPPASSH